jgi:hypothetical protein
MARAVADCAVRRLIDFADLAVGERASSFKAISAGMLSPLGIIFGLFVVFTAAQVWQDNERANREVNREASALRAVVVLAASLPRETEARLRAWCVRSPMLSVRVCLVCVMRRRTEPRNARL